LSRLAPIALGALMLGFLLPTFQNGSGIVAMPLLAEACSAVLIMTAFHAKGSLPVASHPVSAYLGRLSYGIYIWHFPAVYWLRDNYSWPVALAASAAFALAMAALTYHFVDAPIRRWRAARGAVPMTA